MQYTGGRDIEHPGAIDRRGRAVGPGADGHPDRPRQGQPLVRHCQGIGRAINAEVLAELERTRIKLDNHIKTDDERAADMHRARILRFNQELIRQIPHTREEFIEVLTEIDRYQRFAGSTRNIPTAGPPMPSQISAGCTMIGYKSTISCDYEGRMRLWTLGLRAWRPSR